MSESDLKMVSEILNGILNPDNTIRNQAAAKIEELRKNTPMFLFCLIKILNESNSTTEKTVSAVLIRKIIELKDNMAKNPQWEGLNADMKSTMKNLSLEALSKETDKSLQSKMAEVIIEIAHNIFEGNLQKWPELTLFVLNVLNLEFNEANLTKYEFALRLFEGIYGCIYEELKPKLENILEKLLFCIKACNNCNTKAIPLSAKAVRTISEMIIFADKKELKHYKEFVLPIMSCTLEAFKSQKHENELKMCCKAIIDICSNQPHLFKKSFPDLFILMGQVSEHQEFDDENLRELGFEVILNLVEHKDVLFKKDEEKLNLFIKSLYKYALEMDEDINTEWSTPTTSYFEEEFIYEKEVSCSLTFIERLVDTLGEEFMLPFCHKYITELMGNSQNWKCKYIALMSIRGIIAVVKDMSDIENIFPYIFDSISSNNPKVRYAALSCIEELADEFKFNFSNVYHEKLIGLVLSRFTDPILRIQLEACETLCTFMEHLKADILATYSQTILDSTFQIFLTKDPNTNGSIIPNNIRECLLNVVSTMASQIGHLFKPFATKCLEILCDWFSNAYGNKVYKPLYGNLIENITLIGPLADKEAYYKIIPSLVKTLVDIQNNIPLSTDPLRDYIKDALNRLVRILKDDFKDLLPSIIQSIIKLVQDIPEMSISSNPEERFKIDDLLSDANSDPNEIKVKVKDMNPSNIKTSQTEDMSTAIEMLNEVIEVLGEDYITYIDPTEKVILPYLTYLINDDVRQHASDTIPIMLRIVSNYASVQNNEESKKHLINKSKYYCTELVQAVERELDNETMCYLLENMKDVIDIANGFLNQEEVNQFFAKLISTFDTIEQRRLKLVEKRKEVEKDINTKKSSGVVKDEDEDDDDEQLEKDLADDIEAIQDIQTEISDCVGFIFKTHKALSKDVIDVILKERLPLYFRTGASSFETKMGLFLVDDMVEFLGQEFLPTEIWDQMAKAVISYSNIKNDQLRQAAVYGIGMFAKETKKDFERYANDCLVSLSGALNMPYVDGNEEDWGLARDNAVASLGKIIKYQPNSVDLKNFVPKWLFYLPLKTDEIEFSEQHNLFCDIILQRNDLILGENGTNLPKIIKTLAQILKTKYSNEEIDTKIATIVGKMKMDSNIWGLVNTLYNNESDSKLKKKMEKLINL